MSIPEDSQINDSRLQDEMKGISFSNFKKTEVKQQLLSAIVNCKIEPACYWCAELVCAGHFLDVWEILLLYLGKYVHVGNIRLAVYLDNRYNIFRNICKQGNFIQEFDLRNNPEIRKLFAEVIYVCSNSRQKNPIEVIKINRVEEFDITQLSDRLKAPSIDYLHGILKPKDPKEFTIPLNELSYHLDERNMPFACYWIEWMIEFDHFCRTNKKKPCICEPRSEYPVEPKLTRDIVWMIWDIFMIKSGSIGIYIKHVVDAVMRLFCIRYTTASSRKRKYLLYFAVSLITEQISENKQPFVPDQAMLSSLTSRIHTVYKQIKKNEQNPKTDYLYKNLVDSRANFEQTIQRINLMNQFDTVG
jgi:hypothetical protein